jgi:predicted TIM-barrel fold metal-dependent hydrolase
MAKYQPKLNVSELVAIDVHTHANVSQRQAPDPCSIIMDEAMAKYFKSRKPPTIPELAQYYRERKMAAVIFTVDSEAEMGHWRIANEEVAEVAAEHSDVLIPFASIDPAKGTACVASSFIRPRKASTRTIARPTCCTKRSRKRSCPRSSTAGKRASARACAAAWASA